MAAQETVDELLTVVIAVLRKTLAIGEVPPLPEVLACNADFQSILTQLLQNQQFAMAIAKGDLSGSLNQKGRMAGSLKTLQANLRHLTWQTQMIAQGDFSQRVDFMGEFSTAFNTMVSNLEKAQGELHAREARLATLYRATQEISASIDREQICVALHKAAAQVLPLDAFGIALLVNEGQEIEDVYLYDAGQRWPGRRHPLGSGLSSYIMSTGQSLRADDIAAAVAQLGISALVYGDTAQDTLAAVAAPLQLRGQVIGMLSVQAYAPQRYTPEDQELLEMLAAYGAAAFENARLYDAALEAQRSAEEAQQAAEAANRAKSIFLANMSHELRTPLNAMLGFTQLMVNAPNLTATQRENLEIVSRSGEHLLALINDVLEISKIEAGRVELHPGGFDLVHMLQGITEMFRLRAEQKGLYLAFELAPDVPRYIHADEGKLRQVLINLLGNAVKFTTVGGVTLRVWSMEYGVWNMEHEVSSQESEASRQNQGIPSSLLPTPYSLLPTPHSLPPTPYSLLPTPCSLLHFAVTDTGSGIAPEEQAAIFDAFVQTASGRQSGEGTGLGLPISRQYVRMMGGELRVESAPGRGSCFAFDLPVTTPTASASPQDFSPARQPRVIGLAPGQHAPMGGPYRLLVVEDVAANRKLLVDLLQSWSATDGGPPGFEVREAANGQEAVTLWEQWQPHLIWMDIRMPVLDGYEAIRLIKASHSHPIPVIVALTAGAFEEERDRILAEGCDDFVRKPFQQTEIRAVLERHLGLRFVSAESGAADSDSQAGEAPSPSEFSVPDEWRAELRKAAIQGDSEWMTALIGSIQPQAPSLAQQLREWIDAFEYTQILDFLTDGWSGTALDAPECEERSL